ncbi:MAG TPA: RNA polymerase factor sigma-54 [Rhodanobacteraceae bacterium]|nr:RNA polymerase factor sigma-54 [Rhodanobacteraceae bacterium]
MKPGLQFRLHQQLALTPQLQQAIRLLQLSNLELEVELRQLTEANPMLMVEDLDGDPGEGDRVAEDPAANSPVDADSDGESATSDFDPGDAPLEFNGSYPQPHGGGGFEADDIGDSAETLREHLLWQLNLSSLGEREQAIALAVVDAIDDDGYLREENASIAAAVAGPRPVAEAEIEAVRQRLLRFDPPGIGSRDLRECLAIQLELLPRDSLAGDLARRIVDSELDLLARGDMARIARRLQADPRALDEAVALVRSLQPHPGAGFDSTPTEYITPDAYAHCRDGRWLATLSPDCMPRVQINQHYCGLMAQLRSEDASYLRGQLQEARWLLKSLQSRADTILKVANAIVRAQSAFLDYGPEAMRPLVLRDVAEEVEMHESTISRVTTRKYLHTPRGIYEFKYFFSSGVGTEDGGSASATAVQAMIRKLIDSEDRRRPLSDQALARELQERGIHVARRTVAKYREGLRIPTSSQRVNMEQR